MTLPIYFDSKKSLNLFGLIEDFLFIKRLYTNNKLPKVLMLSGKKGSGKSTLINHLIFYIHDKENYDEKNYEYSSESKFYNQFINNINSNLIYLSGSNFKNSQIEDVRLLKEKIFQTSIDSNPRFIILDEVELFNNNSLNALLKTIEEPTKNNYFLLINNKTKPLIETVKSRCLEIKIILDEEKRSGIIDSLIKKYKINLVIDPKSSQLTPGNFIKFNYIFEENNIFIEKNFIDNLTILLGLYKKNKDTIFIDMTLFLADNYLNVLKNKKLLSHEKIIELKRFIFDSIHKYFLYNLNQKALLNNINNKIIDE
jgi:nucleoside-triphosphatase THEP1